MTTRPLRVYHVSYAFKPGERWEPHVLAVVDPGDAEAQAKMRRGLPKLYACVKVSGPHDHEVPA